MHFGRIIFAQLIDHLPRHEFNKCVARYDGDYKFRGFSCLDQFLCLTFAQLTFRESLRDIEVCLRSVGGKLYHMGFRGRVSRSTLADANEAHDWRIYAGFAQVLIHIARPMYANDDLAVDLDNTVYALDSTTIELCLSLFRRSRFSSATAAVKIHTLLDLRGPIPAFIEVSTAKKADVKILDTIIPEPGAFYVMDRGYVDFARLHRLHLALAFFVTRTKKGIRFKRRYSRPVDRTTGLRSDLTVVLAHPASRQRYPEPLRLIRFYDETQARYFRFVTNNFNLPALMICQLYKCRWQVELFFKWIKQNLRIKAFYGNSENAVKTQIWIAVSVYVLVAIIKKRLDLPGSLHEILQVLSVTLFEQTPILQAFQGSDLPETVDSFSNQLNLFEL